jgi:tripartite-type tricarboxylate transporter receptor subunit TctC
VDFTFAVVATIAAQIASGKVRGLAVTRGRAPQLPDIPGMEELGYPSVTSTSDMGVVVRTGTPAAVVEKLEGLCLKALKDEQFRALLLQRGFQPLGLTGVDYRTYIDREIDAWAKVIEAGNIKPE